MGDISKDFNRHEHACNCGCGFNTVDVELNSALQDLRDHFNSTVTITGPNRCKKRNTETPGASPTSLHLEAKAADVKVKGVHPERVYNYLNSKYPSKYELIRYHNRVHIGITPRRRRGLRV